MGYTFVLGILPWELVPRESSVLICRGFLRGVGAHLTPSVKAPKVSVFIKLIIWGFPDRQGNANSYNTPSEFQRQVSYFFFLHPLASLLPRWLSELGILSDLQKGPFLGGNVAWDFGLKSRASYVLKPRSP